MTADYDEAEDSRLSYDMAIKAIRAKKIAAGEIAPISRVDDYDGFIRGKTSVHRGWGFEPSQDFPDGMKPFQSDITTWACRRGRSAIFAGTGLGKSLMELVWAREVCRKTGGNCLIFTPLAVAQQMVLEAEKFGIDGVSFQSDGDMVSTPITVTNYDRRHRFDIEQFAGVVLDESGIIKDHDSKTRIELTDSCRDTVYLLCGSATPAPNDWTELGQHSEFLGVMTAKEMLAMYFVHDGAVRAKDGDEWRLKRHAETDFWRWVASWAVMVRHPRELGYEDDGYDLPPLTVNQITVRVPMGPTSDSLFPMQANTLQERIVARRDSIESRVAAAAEIVNSSPNDPWLVWCNLNAEASALVKAIPGAVNVQGSDKPSVKSDRLLGFAHGAPRVLISKPSIAGRGMNWQHCSKMVFVGLNDSFEQFFQAVRRCWRFGQTNEVTAYMIASEMEGAVVANLKEKERKYEAMADAMSEHMADLCVESIRGAEFLAGQYEPKKQMGVPLWMK